MTPEKQLAKPNGALVHRDEFGATQVQVQRETAATAVAAREKAAVEARYIMALQRPRSIERTREQLLKACSYPDFAESAWYSRPAGRAKNKDTGQWEDTYAEGFSIRFAEEAIRAFGNVYPEMSVVYEGEEERIVRITVTDMEANVPYSTEIVIKKQVERKKLKEGQVSIGQRQNSAGETVFIVEATDDEILQRVNALRSKAVRTDGLRLIPAWLKEECKRAIFATMEGKFKADPDASKRKIIDGFRNFNVSVQDLEAYLGKSIDKVAHAEIMKLQPIYNALKEGETSWDRVMEDRQPTTEDERKGSREAQEAVLEKKLRENNVTVDVKPETTETTDKPEPTKAAPQRGFFGGTK